MTYSIATPLFRVFAVIMVLLGSAAALAGTDTVRGLTAPTGLRVTDVSPTSVTLAWTPSISNTGPFFYVLFSGNTAVANAGMSATSLTLTGLTPATTCSFRLRARDSSSLKWSGYSNMVTVTTLPASTTVPAPVLSASSGPTHIALSWTVPPGAAPPLRYWVYRDGALLISWHQTNAVTFYLQNPGTTHTYTVQVRDGNGVFSTHSNAITVTTPQPDPSDHTPPSTPTNLNEMHFGDGEFWLTWTESTDNITPQAFIRYNVYVNGVLSDIVVGRRFPSINYGNVGQLNTVEVIAIDEANNASPPATMTFLLN